MKTNIAFWYDRPIEYSGGLNYIHNLLYAISVSRNDSIKPYVFFGKNVDIQTIKRFSKLAIVIQTSLLDRKSPLWFIQKILLKTLNSYFLINQVLKKHNISIISHAEHISKCPNHMKLLYWIPDLQYLHLPNLFPGLDIKSETNKLIKFIETSDMTVLSSENALSDLKKITSKEHHKKISVLQFVSQPDPFLISNADSNDEFSIIQKNHSLNKHFFYMPNQFWQHKNHKVVCQAVKILKSRGLNVIIVCTGNTMDYRLKDNKEKIFMEIKQYIHENHLEENIKLLGLVEYSSVLLFMKYCLAVINPSFFEGWSSTVEEAKSIGKLVILSNIPVHIEQSPLYSNYFSPNDPDELANILEKTWEQREHISSKNNTEETKILLHNRTVEYGEKYIKLINQLRFSV